MFITQQMVGTLLLGTVYVSPINSCVYNSVNDRESTIVDGICCPINSCVYDSVNGRDSTIGDGIC